MIIENTCVSPEHYRRSFGYFPRARDAFGAILDANGVGANDRVLLPSYIGWSPREGSGVFDPITARKITPVFYRMDAFLHIDEAHFVSLLASSGAKAALIIHYFGFVDPAFTRLSAAAKAAGLVVIEDAAHALYSDMVGGVCGRAGDYTLYSLHKQLPFTGGGMVSANGGRALPVGFTTKSAFGDPFCYDLRMIADCRVQNYRRLLPLLAPLSDELEPLWPDLPCGTVPQTLPVRILHYDRFELYKRLIDAGYYAVALYHTLIEPLRTNAYADSLSLSQSILNFPVHQDVDASAYVGMIRSLTAILKEKHD